VGCGDTIGAIPTPAYRALEGALQDKTKAERDLKMYTNLVSLFFPAPVAFDRFSSRYR
jgi:hypothetical protein